MNLDKAVKQLDKLIAKKARCERIIAVLEIKIAKKRKLINSERKLLEKKLEIINKAHPAAPSLKESMASMEVKKK